MIRISIYKIYRPAAPEKIYIGSTTQNLEKRFSQHKYTGNPKLRNALKKYSDFVIETVYAFWISAKHYETTGIELRNKLECKFISEFAYQKSSRPFYNILGTAENVRLIYPTREEAEEANRANQRAADQRYRKSGKGRARAQRYKKSEKGRAANRRYWKSEKGRANHRAANIKFQKELYALQKQCWGSFFLLHKITDKHIQAQFKKHCKIFSNKAKCNLFIEKHSMNRLQKAIKKE